MMLPTHALAGLALAPVVALAAPELAGVAYVAGLLGGAAPDLDLYAGHRRTLHYPVYGSGLALAAVPVAILAPAAGTVFAAAFLLGAAAHSVSDALGGGLELRPWEATSDRAVYDHHRGRWIAPRRWVRYDGAPEDLLVSAGLALPLSIAFEGALRWVVVAILAVAVVYAAVRRALPGIAVRLLDRLAPALPDRALGRVPPRYLAHVDGRDPETGDGRRSDDA